MPTLSRTIHSPRTKVAKTAGAVLASALVFATLNPMTAQAIPNPEPCVTTMDSVTISDVLYKTVSISNPGVCDWEVPAGISSVSILVVAGGGGGGGGQATVTSQSPGRAGGGGGGAGAVGIDNNVSVTAGSVISVTVGAGGTAGSLGTPTVPPTAGSRGGTSSYVLPDNTTGATGGGFGGGPGDYIGGTGGAEGFNAFTSSAGANSQGSSGSSGLYAGQPTTGSTLGQSISGFSPNAITFAWGGGGGWTFGNGQTENTAGSGGGGGRGSNGSVCSGDDCNGFAGFDGKSGVLVFRFAALSPEAPAAPTAVLSETSADLTWSAPSFDGYADITGYKIESSTDNGDSWATVVTDTESTLTSRTIEDLTLGSSYVFRVSAINAVNASAASASSNTLSLAPPVPTPYGGPLLQDLSQKEIKANTKTQVTLQGSRLEGVTSASVDGKAARIISKTSTTLMIELPELTDGLKDLQITTGIGNLTHQDAFMVLAETKVVTGAVAKKLTAGSFKGFVAIYAKGFQNQRLSAKVGNDWVVIPSLKSDFERIVEFTGAGNEINILIFIDRLLAETKLVQTK